MLLRAKVLIGTEKEKLESEWRGKKNEGGEFTGHVETGAGWPALSFNRRQ